MEGWEKSGTPVRFPGFVGPSYTLSSTNYECQRSMNLYPELDEIGTGKEGEVKALIGSPGTSFLAHVGSGPIRGIWYSSTGVLYVVSGQEVYSVNSSWVETLAGQMLTDTGQVGIADNGFQLFIVDGTYGYYITLPTTAYATIFNFTVSGVTVTPTAGAVYTVNGVSYTVISTSITIGSGTIQVGGASLPTSSGTITKFSGTGDSTITFTAAASLVRVIDPGFLGSDVVTYQDGYFIFNEPLTNKFYISDPNDVTFATSVIATKEGNPDNITSVISMNRSLWVLGDTTSEVWYDSGDNLNPFQYIQGTMMLYGCAAKFSPSKIANNLFWLGKDNTGTAVVLQASTYVPQRISNHAIEFAIQGYSVINDAIGYCYQENGHHFYVLTFPTANHTWVYDLATQMWHERGYNSGGVLQRILSNCYAYAYNTHVTGDYKIGSLYSQSLTTYSDNGVAILRQRTTTHISKDMNRIFYKDLQLDFETSIGLDGTGQGTDPQAMLSWSDDGGHTWSNEHWATMCPIGVTLERAIWRRLGFSRNRVFKISISDPVKVVIIGANINIEEAAS